MKRFLTTLAILLVVILAGLTALVLLINPNDFRGYLIERVEKQSGYKLTLQDDMRWHVWPKLSIISGKMSLTAPGAEMPLVTADNMRLDVELLPLLSHQLEVKEVMLKGAVVRQTPESKAIPKISPPSTPRDISRSVIEPRANNWQLNIAKVNISDSLIIWQMKDGEQLNLRDINLSLKTDEKKQVSLEMSTKVNRDRREIMLNIAANADMKSYPYQVSGNITQLDYALSGVGIPENGIAGSLTSDFHIQNEGVRKISLNNLNLTANDSQLQGNISAEFADTTRYQVDLKGEQLNLNTLLPELAATNTTETVLLTSKDNKTSPLFSLFNTAHAAPAPNATIMAKPVITSVAVESKEYDLTHWSNIEFTLKLALNKLLYKDLEINNFKLDALNNPNSLNIKTLTGQLLQGDFSLPTVISTSIVPAHISMDITMNNIPLQPLLRVFNQPENFSGLISAKGNLEGTGYNRKAFYNYWQGTLNTSVAQFKMQGLNVPQVIQQSVAQATDKVIYPEDVESYTQADNVIAQFKLAPKGKVTINSLDAQAEAYQIKGQGKVDLQRHDLDVMLLVNIKKGWGKENDFIRQLAKIEIPLRLYGDWNAIQYELNIEKLLRDQLQQKAKQAIDNWLNKQDAESPEVKALNQLLKKI
ncbi:outer membrane assembly protein AsmA [Proteus faecis]|uniref:Outer membrane assembly protein AsmA n=1 Tax=Proteus faecis TaxID=2050967 RepID=A0AAW7CPB8_9GAMM|nr:outer membrane assembly protein AsmA [Proteus faecis]MBG3013261.1 outer membrane assembly protein AsmA [Proteus mirabilis]MDL5165649.1 outer membrane assembly protein AsmA [Proteus faecis]MDL5274087.1 outer membrane assembly protein AsmA [Proteus faecis]MDL5277657.1 outer membrane assembly protein AsmA [Proteus faecis]MDL5306647.1 outer membrane assembly protein AsmA [Proteus faecis]